MTVYSVTNTLERAILWATINHANQQDKGGQPYILHPLSVMFRVRRVGEIETVQVVAVLHDTVEDTSLTLQEIRSSFGEVVAEALDALTRRKNESYKHYILRAKKNPIARIVKLEDLHDNLSPQRHWWAMDAASIAELHRLEDRYRMALRWLLSDEPPEALDEETVPAPESE